MICRSIITAIARVTASMSALTKFTVTGALERSAAPLASRRCVAAARAQAWAAGWQRHRLWRCLRGVGCGAVCWGGC